MDKKEWRLKERRIEDKKEWRWKERRIGGGEAVCVPRVYTAKKWGAGSTV